MQRAAEQAYNRVEELRDRYGPPAHSRWAQAHTATYETALRAWRDLARDVQSAVAEYAKAEGRRRNEVEAEVREAARRPGPQE
ncbi:hypothetical protein GCM10027072_51810 [Streptomyces bullii]